MTGGNDTLSGPATLSKLFCPPSENESILKGSEHKFIRFRVEGTIFVFPFFG